MSAWIVRVERIDSPDAILKHFDGLASWNSLLDYLDREVFGEGDALASGVADWAIYIADERVDRIAISQVDTLRSEATA